MLGPNVDTASLARAYDSGPISLYVDRVNKGYSMT